MSEQPSAVEARVVARDWVHANIDPTPSFIGAHLAGSIVDLPPDATLPQGSDVDVVVVTSDPPATKPGKLTHKGILLDVSFRPWSDLVSAEHVLSSYRLAGGFRGDTVLVDPTGSLQRLQDAVSRHFAEERWVRRRYHEARELLRNRLMHIDSQPTWPGQVTMWLFGTGTSTHMLLAAALRNPTVRRRYLAARAVLDDYDRLDRYPELLSQLGCVDWDADLVMRHLESLSLIFDQVCAVARTPFPFSADLTPIGRPIAITAAYDMVRSGDHREAVFWIVATAARCQAVLAADGPEPLREEGAGMLRRLLADLGITSLPDLQQRTAETLRSLPKLDEVGESIMALTAEPDSDTGVTPHCE